MITYLQKHRTFLIVVLSVTVFAFVGAGFVGWGDYGYGSRAGAVAVVGDEKITIEQYVRHYGNSRSYYAQSPDQPLNKDILIQETLESLIAETLLLNYARDIGLMANDDEISSVIMSDQSFYKDGRFDKKAYVAALNSIGEDVKSFEAKVGHQLTINKLAKYLWLPATALEKESVAASRSLADRISYKIIEAPKKIDVSDREKLEYYEANRLRFMDEPKYDVEYIIIAAGDQNASEEEAKNYYEKNLSEFFSEDGEVEAFEAVKEKALVRARFGKARNEARRMRITWRDGGVTPLIAQNIQIRNETLPYEVMLEVENDQSMEISNPIETAEGYALARTVRRINSEPLPFEAVKGEITAAIKARKIKEYLESEGEKQHRTFKGATTKFITRSDTDALKGLNESEAEAVLYEVFISKTKEGYVVLDGRAVLFRVLEQKLFDENKAKEMDEMLGESIAMFKQRQIQWGVLTMLKLQNRYPITRYDSAIKDAIAVYFSD
ncbi:MAG: peptidylprolyl isomerase [Helicobacteraceae bacterium]|jgi:peptidyl-prolyl cis-trans isomerase D|nr:peptidylprolyl isomerase [Helicobacteraceae bacterium]